MIIIPDIIRQQLLKNGQDAKAVKTFDPQPILKLFAPWCGMTWLISEMSPDDNDVLFGLADLDNGEPEVGAILLRVRPGTHDARAMRRIRTMAAAA